ncbi:MAG: echA6 2 [Frankiales bacterium]|nr:echA6 2 [Frankiales bacterium]
MTSAQWPNFSVENIDFVAYVTIDRPSKRNAMTAQMWRDLAAIFTALDLDAELRAVVVTGAGPSFCAGADIGSVSADDAEVKAAVAAAEQAIRAVRVPTIATIRGHCVGGGNQIALACDLRIADETASFAVPPARLGLVYPVSSTRAMVALIGPAETKQLLFTASAISAERALRIGLICEIVPADELTARAAELVAAMLPLSPLTQAAMKQIVNAIADGSDADELQRDWSAQWAASPDVAEGPMAFLERRKPRFSWRPAL